MTIKKRETPITTLELDNLSKYELVLLLARRAREINRQRIELENKLEAQVIEEAKPINQAIEELISGKLKYKKKDKENLTSPIVTKKPTTTI